MSSGRSLHGSGARKEGGKMAKLTVSATKPLVRPGMDRSDDGVEGDLRRRRFGEVVAVDSGVPSARGSACSMEWTAAELLDTMRGRTGGGEHGYDKARRWWRRSWQGSARGRSWRGEGVSRGFGGERGSDPRRHRARGAARWRAGAWRALRSPSGTCLPAWPASSSLERHWAGPAGGPGAGRQVSFSIFSCLLFF